jgi:hypothetical protein
MRTAPLTLLPNHTRPDDYLVMSGDERVGRIYKRDVRRLEWLWAIFRARYAELPDLQLAGRTGSLEKARSELTESWKSIQAGGSGNDRQRLSLAGPSAEAEEPQDSQHHND